MQSKVTAQFINPFYQHHEHGPLKSIITMSKSFLCFLKVYLQYEIVIQIRYYFYVMLQKFERTSHVTSSFFNSFLKYTSYLEKYKLNFAMNIRSERFLYAVKS